MNRSPLYVQLREVLRAKTDEGEYAPGTCIPSENQLAEAYGLTRQSVRSALAALEYEGLLKSMQGKGVYVTGPKLERDLETLGGFRQTMREHEQAPATKTLIKALREAGPLYAEMLGVAPEDALWYIKRICLSNGEPVALEEIFIPAHIVPGFADVDINVFSIFDIYDWNGVRPVRGEQALTISRLDPAAARLIGLESDEAVMQFSGVIYDQDDRAIEFSRSYTRNDKCDFIVHFKR
ncbi:MAG TPA: GntR family transcriptional regulator [Candidatus Limiplasma sp.]|jgi:GntR family transcriptional regulator|nr:GntR family transcriptional regulator [Candidatus Limiplasma sp.]